MAGRNNNRGLRPIERLIVAIVLSVVGHAGHRVAGACRSRGLGFRRLSSSRLPSAPRSVAARC